MSPPVPSLGGAGVVLRMLLSTVDRAAAIDPPHGSSFQDAGHVVIPMQENRSFDHMFGPNAAGET